MDVTGRSVWKGGGTGEVWKRSDATLNLVYVW